MHRFVFVLLCSIAPFIATAQQTDSAAFRDVRNVLDQQVVAWNKADVDGFMAGYWKSDSLRFIGKNGIKYGWTETRDNYKKSYPDQKTMGVLKFGIDRMERLGPDAVFVVGSWNLDREKPVGGWFTLLFRKKDGRWVIVLDHTS